jgi:hypothetical protein
MSTFKLSSADILPVEVMMYNIPIFRNKERDNNIMA